MKVNKYSFFKVFWPALVAVLVGSMASFIPYAIVMAIVAGGFVSSSDRVKTQDNSILHMRLEGDIRERSSSKIDVQSMSINHTFGLADLLYGLQCAKQDNKIRGVFLDVGDISCGISTAKEIRNALIDFKKEGKFVVAYNSGEYVSLNKYYISACADELYGFPTTNIAFLGLANELLFFKNTFDKLGVDVEIIRGYNNDFKSAVEPFFLDKMSDSSRLQMQVFLDTIWHEMCRDIASDRKLDAQLLNDYADDLTVRSVKDAVDKKMMDGSKYRDEVITILKKKIKVNDDKELPLVNFEKYAKTKFKNAQTKIKSNKPTIAVIVAEGEIAVDGDGLSSRRICKLIEQARNNEHVKSVVLRINSPGGSALASEEIWREIVCTDSIKPVVVSMGDLAASGGYYIATPARKIFAEPTTITGSIGVFGVIPHFGDFMHDKLGFSFDYVQTNKHQLPTFNRKLTQEELQVVQDEVNEIYSDFVSKVAEGRKLSHEQTQRIARGRVWTGTDAVKIGLVDEIGGVNEAIAYAKKIVKLDNAQIVYYPLVKTDPLEDILEQIQGEQGYTNATTNATFRKELLQQYRQVERLEHLVGIQMRLPYLVNFE